MKDYPLHFQVTWDYDTLQHSLRRGYLKDYNFYSIFLERKRDYWKNIDLEGGTECFYIGSTRVNSTSSRLLSNHDGLEAALKEGFGDVFIALGYLDQISHNLSIKQWNDIIRYIEAGMIKEFKPTKNTVNRLKYDGPFLIIENHLNSYCGLKIEELVINRTVKAVDDLLFSDNAQYYLDNFFSHGPDAFDDGLIQILGQVGQDLNEINSKVIVE